MTSQISLSNSESAKLKDELDPQFSSSQTIIASLNIKTNLKPAKVFSLQADEVGQNIAKILEILEGGQEIILGTESIYWRVVLNPTNPNLANPPEHKYLAKKRLKKSSSNSYPIQIFSSPDELLRIAQPNPILTILVQSFAQNPVIFKFQDLAGTTRLGYIPLSPVISQLGCVLDQPLLASPLQVNWESNNLGILATNLEMALEMMDLAKPTTPANLGLAIDTGRAQFGLFPSVIEIQKSKVQLICEGVMSLAQLQIALPFLEIEKQTKPGCLSSTLDFLQTSPAWLRLFSRHQSLNFNYTNPNLILGSKESLQKYFLSNLPAYFKNLNRGQYQLVNLGSETNPEIMAKNLYQNLYRAWKIQHTKQLKVYYLPPLGRHHPILRQIDKMLDQLKIQEPANNHPKLTPANLISSSAGFLGMGPALTNF